MSDQLFRNLKPVNVSPLIKLSRWTLLIMGIFYGASRQAFLAEREVAIHEEEEIQRKIREKQIAEERRLTSERDIQYLADIINGKIKG